MGRRLDDLSNLASRFASRLVGRQSTLGRNVIGGTHALGYLRNLARGNSVTQKSGQRPKPMLERHPVLIVHGFLGTRGSMYALERRLANDGFRVFSFNLGTFNTRDIRRSAFLIHRKIEGILEQTGVRKIDILGHSMGGLIGLYYVKKLGGHERVRKLVLLGAPVRGTWVALAGVLTLGALSTSSWQLLPKSSFLRELAQGPLPRTVAVYTIAAENDWVCPPHTTTLEGATARVVPMGHSALVMSDEVYQHVVSALLEEIVPRPETLSPFV